MVEPLLGVHHIDLQSIRTYHRLSSANYCLLFSDNETAVKTAIGTVNDEAQNS